MRIPLGLVVMSVVALSVTGLAATRPLVPEPEVESLVIAEAPTTTTSTAPTTTTTTIQTATTETEVFEELAPVRSAAPLPKSTPTTTTTTTPKTAQGPSAPETSRPATTTTTTLAPTTKTTKVTAPSGRFGAEEEADFRGRINGLRTSNGLSALTQDGSLDDRARDWARYMGEEGRLSHSNLSSLIPPWSAAGENVGTPI